MSTRERLAALRLIRTETIGPMTFHGLIARYRTAEAALAAAPSLAARGGRRKPLTLCSENEAERELAALEELGASLAAPEEPGYPPRLAEIDSAPPLLAVQGHLHLAERHAVALVGARNASALGRRLAADLAAALGEAGYLVVSGLARGIDTAAHQAALDSGTAAVVAGGIDHIYPVENTELHGLIAERGLLLSEMPPGFAPTPQHFPRRNRLIAGMSLGVVVIEAALRSGSLITARLAAEQGREVFAVPGSPLDPRARGTNDLLRQGATLVESVDDILPVIEPLKERRLGEPVEPRDASGEASEPGEDALAAVRREVTTLLSPYPVGVDELVRLSGAPAGHVQIVLLELELAGRLIRHAGGKVALDPAARA